MTDLGNGHDATMPRRKVTWLCFEAHRRDGLVWAVRHGNRWHRAKTVLVHCPMTTVYRPKSREPRAYLRGLARLTKYGNTLILT